MSRNNKSNKKQDTKQSEPDGKLSFFEKLAVKKIIKHAKKKLRKYKEKAEENANERHFIEESIIKLKELFEITNEKGEELTEENIKLMPQKELEELFEELLDMFKKEIWK